jgi:3-deoxy-D-manno-octulosonic acid kinase
MPEVRTIPFPGGALCVSAELAGGATPAWLDPRANRAQPVTQGGRQAAWFVEGEFGQAVLRHYRRGGLRAKLGSQDYLWLGAARTRSFAEFRVLTRLHARGLAVPRPIAAAYWRRGLWYRAAILIERVAGARTVAGVLAPADPTDPQVDPVGDRDAHLGADPEAVARAIFAMHEAGVWHADLNAHNILLDPTDRVWLIDFDRACVGVVSRARRRKNLLRLRRSLVKVSGAHGARWWSRLDAAYERLSR